MSKKRMIIIIKWIIELVILVLLVLLIIHLISSENGILAKANEMVAQEKLDEAIRIFSATNGMNLKTALEAIEGLEDLQINTETGEYNIKIDGQDFLVVSKELIPNKEQNNITDNVKQH